MTSHDADSYLNPEAADFREKLSRLKHRSASTNLGPYGVFGEIDFEQVKDMGEELVEVDFHHPGAHETTATIIA